MPERIREDSPQRRFMFFFWQDYDGDPIYWNRHRTQSFVSEFLQHIDLFRMERTLLID